MTVLYSNNFDSGSGTLNPAPGFATAMGAGLREQAVSSTEYVSASRAIGANGFGDCAYVAAGGEIGDRAVRTAIKWNSQHATPTYMGHLLRFNNGNRYYATHIFTNGTDSIKVFVYKYDGGYSEIATSGFVLAVSAGDVVHHESKVSGTTIESRIWKNAEPRPATPTVSVTDVSSPFYSGYAGLHKGWSESSTAAYCDDLVITDGAGGEDFFHPDILVSNGTAEAGTGTSTGSGVGGDASTNGGSNANAGGGTGTSTGSGSGGDASGLAGGTGSFTSDAMENNSGAGLLASTLVRWTWYQGTIGTAPTSTTHGTGTTSAGGVLTIAGLPTGAGFLLARTADSTGVYYQPGTVA